MPSTLAQLSHIFETHLQSVSYTHRQPSTLYTPIAYLLHIQGKRIRPIITLMTYELLHKEIDEYILHASTAIELFHNFTLIHDDIIDQSATRRGKPTVHEKYGINAGILSGDALMILAYQTLDKLPTRYFPELLALFNHIALGICEGQQLDINFEQAKEVSLEEYYKMIELKTSILLGLSFQISGVIAGADKEDLTFLFEVGKYLGMAYQIQDDYLDVFGQFEHFGKPIGNDIWLNKKTYLSILALSLASPAQKQTFATLQYEANKEKKIRETQSIFKELQVDVFAQQAVVEFNEQINNVLTKIKAFGDSERKHLSDFAFQLIHRSK